MIATPSSKVLSWLRANLGHGALAPLTGTDVRSLRAAVEIIEAYTYNRTPDLLCAFGLVVRQMQPKCQEFAYHAIALVMDWSDRPTIWQGARLAPLSPRMVCQYSPEKRGVCTR